MAQSRGCLVDWQHEHLAVGESGMNKQRRGGVDGQTYARLTCGGREAAQTISSAISSAVTEAPTVSISDAE